jgi:hypothetical protein
MSIRRGRAGETTAADQDSLDWLASSGFRDLVKSFESWQFHRSITGLHFAKRQ